MGADASCEPTIQLASCELAEAESADGNPGSEKITTDELSWAASTPDRRTIIVIAKPRDLSIEFFSSRAHDNTG